MDAAGPICSCSFAAWTHGQPTRLQSCAPILPGQPFPRGCPPLTVTGNDGRRLRPLCLLRTADSIPVRCSAPRPPPFRVRPSTAHGRCRPLPHPRCGPPCHRLLPTQPAGAAFPRPAAAAGVPAVVAAGRGNCAFSPPPPSNNAAPSGSTPPPSTPSWSTTAHFLTGASVGAAALCRGRRARCSPRAGMIGRPGAFNPGGIHVHGSVCTHTQGHPG